MPVSAVSALVFVLQIWQTLTNVISQLMSSSLRTPQPVQTTSYGSSYHHLLYRITISGTDHTIGNFQTID